MTEDSNKTVTEIIDEKPYLEALKSEADEKQLSVEFWLKFPIEVRPLKLVPGRNRREKRTFRALAAQQERGTITRTKPGRNGGNLVKLERLLAALVEAGVVRFPDEKKE